MSKVIQPSIEGSQSKLVPSFIYGKQWYRWVILFAAVIIYSTSQLVRWNYTSITKFLTADLSIGKPELGILGAAFFYAYACVQVLWGVAADRFGLRYIVPIGVVVLGCFLAGFSTATTYQEAIYWRIAMGFAAGAAYVPICALVARWFSMRERGLAMSMMSGFAGAIGETLSFVLIPLFAILMTGGSFFGLVGWRASTVLMGALICLLALISYCIFRNDPSDIGLPSVIEAEDKPVRDASYKAMVIDALKQPTLWLITIVYSVYTIGCRLGPAWFPLYASNFYMERGMSKEMAIVAGGGMAVLFVLGRCVGVPIIGYISDICLKKFSIRIPRAVFLAITMLMLILSSYSMTLHISSPIALGIIFFTFGTGAAAFPLTIASVSELISVKAVGFTMAFKNTVAQFAAATVLSYSGYMAVKYTVEGTGFHLGFVGIWYLGIICGVVGLLASLPIIPAEFRLLKQRAAENRI